MLSPAELERLAREKAEAEERRAREEAEKQLEQKKKIAATGTVRMRLTRREEEEMKQSAQKAGQLGPRRRQFLATYQGGTKQAQVDDEGKVIFFSGKGQDPHGSMTNLGSEDRPQMVPVSHVQPVAAASAAVE